MTQPVAIGVDLGGTKIAFAAVDRDGAILATHAEPTLAPEGADAVIGRIAGGIERLAADFDIAGIGIGAPGPVVNGIALNAVNLGWQGVPLVENVRARIALDAPIWAQNDVNAGAVAELVFGAARGMSDFVYLAVGTGLGGGAVANGRLINGALGFAMEVGHASIDPHGRLCSCGNHGCVEMYCSGKGLLAGVREHLPEFPDSLLTYESAAPAIIAAMRTGDPLALRVLSEAADALGTTLAWCVMMLNPALIVIGGGLGIAA
ncbi:MAG: ROK family protein, partial [Anaerolineae bacterium]|nr:ROK family protein [Anaerolineae bacterium]